MYLVGLGTRMGQAALGITATLALVCAGCMGETWVVALGEAGSTDGDASEDGGTESDDDPGHDSTSFDLGSGALDPDLLDPEVPRSCATAWKFPSSMGCTFYAIDLDQAGLNDHDPWGVAIINVQSDADATVDIAVEIAGQWIPIVEGETIAAGDAELIPLPDLHHEGSGVFGQAAFRIESDVPVGALQLSPLAGGLSWRSGAALLQPLASWTATTHVLGWRTQYEIGQPAYVSIVAAVDGTTVSVVPTMQTAAGPGLEAGVPGVEMKATIDAGGVLQLAGKVDEIDSKHGLTGTLVSSGGEHPVGVFTAHACAGLPNVEGNECGHMQEQMNMHLQGTRFVASRMMVRNPSTPEPTLFQLYALEDDTSIEWVPGPGTQGVPLEGLTLNRGQSYSTWVTGVTETSGDFVLNADKPVLMAAYMGNPPPNQVGSASMVQLPPIDRHLAEYTLYVAPGWDAQVAAIARPVGSKVAIDGTELDDASFEPLGDYESARIPIEPGVHRIVGSEPFLLMANGVRKGDGYAYLGGWATPTPAFPPPK